MKLSFSKTDLINAVQTVQSAVSVKSTLPILSNLLIQVEKPSKEFIQNKSGSAPRVRIVATDLDAGVRCTVKAEILKEGRITVPAKRFGDLVREMPDGKEIEVGTSDGKRIELKCGKVRANLVALPPDDFPIVPEFPKSDYFRLTKSVFREMIRKTSFAISTDETRHVLNGIFFAMSGGELKMVATDGRRLAFISKNGAEKNLSASVIIPNKAISELLRLLSMDSEGKEDWLEIAPAQNQISFKWMNNGEEIVLVSRIIEGAFPNYDQVIPKSKEIELKVKNTEILAAVKRAALFAQDRGGSIRFSLSERALKISANAQGVGEEEEELEVDYAGPDFEIAFNPAFLSDVLKNSDSPEILFEFSTSLNPVVIKPSVPSRTDGVGPGKAGLPADELGNGGYLCVIMPMRLQ